MPRPGTDVIVVDEAVPGGPVLDTGQAFWAGVAERGPVGQARLVQSLTAYRALYGARAGGAILSDSAFAFFQEGGSRLYISRISGPAALASTGSIATSDVATPTTIDVEAASPGAWGDTLTVGLEVATGDTQQIVVRLDGEVVQRSGAVASAGEAAAFVSDWVRLSVTGDPAAALATPAAEPVALAGGADDATADADTVALALEAFNSDLGPGQVCAPGLTDPDVHRALLTHCDNTYRVALCDAASDDDEAALISRAQTLYSVPGCRFSSLWAPWILYPSQAPPATILVPFSAVECGLIARVDALGNPNSPAAGVAGISRLGLGLSANYSDAARRTINEAGVCLGKIRYGDVRAYGYRTVAGPMETNWLWFGNSRVIMSIAYECDAAGENYVLQQVDGRRHLLAKLDSDLRGICLRYFNAGALYGETPEEAFNVDTSDQVNPVESIAAGVVRGIVRVKCSPSAEWVVIEVVKVPVEKPI